MMEIKGSGFKGSKNLTLDTGYWILEPSKFSPPLTGGDEGEGGLIPRFFSVSSTAQRAPRNPHLATLNS